MGRRRPGVGPRVAGASRGSCRCASRAGASPRRLTAGDETVRQPDAEQRLARDTSLAERRCGRPPSSTCPSASPNLTRASTRSAAAWRSSAVPLVYAIETADLPGGVELEAVSLPCARDGLADAAPRHCPVARRTDGIGGRRGPARRDRRRAVLRVGQPRARRHAGLDPATGADDFAATCELRSPRRTGRSIGRAS